MEIRRNTYHFQAGILASLFCFILLSSCNNDKIVASVGDVHLSENDAYVLMQHAGLSMDSTNHYRDFVEQWVAYEVYKAEIKEKYPEDVWRLINLRSESFKGDLAQFYLEETELRKQLDTVVTSDEVQNYYDNHKDEFILHDYIVKALYIKIPVDVDFKEKKLNQTYLLKNDKDIIEVNSYAKLYAANFYYNDSTWIYFDELAKDIPITKYNVDNIILNRTKTYFSDENYTYFLNIIDYKLKDEAPPVDFLQNEIKSIIVANRLHELKEKNESTLIQRLKKKYEIDIHL